MNDETKLAHWLTMWFAAIAMLAACHVLGVARGNEDRAMKPLTWNANILNDDPRTGRRTADFRGKHVNYAEHDAASRLTWSPIRAEFSGDGSNGFTLSGSPFKIEAPALATGRVLLANAMEYDVHRRTRIAAPTQTLTLVYPDASPVAGVVLDNRRHQVLYRNAFGDGADLAYGLWHARGPRAEHVIVFRSMPRTTGLDYVEIAGEIMLGCTQRLRHRGADVDLGRGPRTINGGESLLDNGTGRGSSFRQPVAWYYDAAGQMVRVPIECRIERQGRKVMLVKRIPRAFILAALQARPGGELRTDATLTVYPDSTESTSVDGDVARRFANESWSTLRSGAGNYADYDSTNDYLCSANCTTTTSQYGHIWRGITLFDTSALGSSATVTSATASIYCSSKVTGIAVSYLCYGVSPASNTSLANSDYGTFGTTAYCDSSISGSSLTTSAYNDFALNSTGLSNISKTSITKIGWRTVEDATNSAPPWSSNATGSFVANYAESSNDPTLVIGYTVQSSYTPRSIVRGANRGLSRGAC